MIFTSAIVVTAHNVNNMHTSYATSAILLHFQVYFSFHSNDIASRFIVHVNCIL